VNLPLSFEQMNRFGIQEKIVQASFFANYDDGERILEDVFLINGTDHMLELWEIAVGETLELLPTDSPVMSTVGIEAMDQAFVPGFPTQETQFTGICIPQSAPHEELVCV
jgi:hypothetical protein